MKKIFLTIISISLFLVSCKNNEKTEPQTPYQPGQSVTLQLVCPDGGNQAPIRMIQGAYGIIEGKTIMNCQWQLEEGDNIYVTYNGNTETFTLSSVDGKVATCEGTMPEGWKSGSKFTIVAGVEPSITTPPSISDIDAGFDGIRRGYMRFEGEGTDITDPITISAAWSAMRINVQFSPDKSYVEDCKIFIKEIAILNSAKQTLYTYSCKNSLFSDQNDGIYLIYKGGQSGDVSVNLTNIVNPGEYNGFIYKITLDLTKCKLGTSGTPATTKDIYAFQYYDEGEAADLELKANKFLLQTSSAEIEMAFNE